ncbi:MAG: hypothetical protein PHY12_12920 [Eubacteriales bacterium]|nr:hypothetical protein [Eubacteriales bacterium]
MSETKRGPMKISKPFQVLLIVLISVVVIISVVCKSSALFWLGLFLSGSVFFGVFGIRYMDPSKARAIFLALAAFMLVVAVVLIVQSGQEEIVDPIVNRVYTWRMGNAVDAMNSDGNGKKYTVYNSETKLYLHRALPSEYLANSPEEVAGVFVISTKYDPTGKYSSGFDGYTIVYNIYYKSPTTSDDDMSFVGSVRGGNPPERISSGVLQTFLYQHGWAKATGKKPSMKEVSKTIVKYIQ